MLKLNLVSRQFQALAHKAIQIVVPKVRNGACGKAKHKSLSKVLYLAENLLTNNDT